MGDVAFWGVNAVRIWVLALVVALCGGCTFSRVRTNPEVADLETAWIVPGTTTYREVVGRLGMPPPVGQADSAPAFVSAETLHWLSTDTRIFELKVGYIVSPIFRRSRTAAADDVLIRFDNAGVVRQVSRTRRRGDETTVLDFREARP